MTDTNVKNPYVAPNIYLYSFILYPIFSHKSTHFSELSVNTTEKKYRQKYSHSKILTTGIRLMEHLFTPQSQIPSLHHNHLSYHQCISGSVKLTPRFLFLNPLFSGVYKKMSIDPLFSV